MTVKTLIEKLSHYNKNAIVRLHHREGEELLFALAFQNDDTTVVLETENDNDMREEIQARFDAALDRRWCSRSYERFLQRAWIDLKLYANNKRGK